MKGQSLWERFHDKFVPEPNSGCWLWTAAITGRDGRGTIYASGRVSYAHRVAWVLYKGGIPEGLSVLHTCDVPSCVNPEHLFLGTQLDNMRDCAAKHRIVSIPRRGDDQPNAVLTSENVEEIKTKALSDREYADKFGMRIEHINRIQRGERWGHIRPPFVVERPKRIQTPEQASRAAYMRAWNASRRTSKVADNRQSAG